MPYNFKTKRCEPPPSLDAIYAMNDPKERLRCFEEFLYQKTSKLQLPLTPEEQMFENTLRMFGIIPGDGWITVFNERYNWSILQGIIDVLRFCGIDGTADAVQEARELFYNGRSDLLTIGARSDAGIRGFRHPTERKRFYALGEIVEQLPYSQSYYQLLRWPDAHRTHFIDL